jgi:hypothetical protein
LGLGDGQLPPQLTTTRLDRRAMHPWVSMMIRFAASPPAAAISAGSKLATSTASRATFKGTRWVARSRWSYTAT